MNKLQLAKYAGLGAVCFFIGIGAGASGQSDTKTETQPKVETHTVYKTKTETVYRTPAACKSALDTDNKIFTKTADALSTFDFDSLTSYINSVTDQRTADYAECVAS